MSNQLEQLAGYLDRDGVSEVVIGIGRPIAMRTKQGLQNLTARPVNLEQFTTLVRGTAIATMIPQADSVSEAVEIAIGKRRARIQIGRRGDEIVVTISRPDATAKPYATQVISKIAEKPTRAVTNSDRDELPSARAPRMRTEPPADLAAPASARAPRMRTEPPVDLAAPATDKRPTEKLKPSDTPMTFALDDALDFGTGNEPPRAPARPPAPPPQAMSLDIDLDSHRPSPPLRVAPPTPPPQAMSLDIDLDSHRPSPPITPAAPAASFRAPTPAPIATPPPPAARPAPPPPAQIVSSRPVADVPPEFAAILRAARQRGASDLHIAAARVTSIRTMGELVPLDPHAQPLDADDAEAILGPLMDDASRAQLAHVGYVDFALGVPDGGRLRANISKQQAGLKGTFRLALAAPATLEQLGLPTELGKVVGHHQGLVIVAGPSGHGKTTTLAALVDLVNSTRPYHILTIEDPIEIVHPRKQAVISQRETGRHTVSFARGLKASLREDPDVIVIGELRDRESVEIALTAAETGHLVIATMSTPSAAKTIDRLIDMFPPEEHSQVRASVAGALRAIVAQRLLPKKGGGIVPAIELVTGVLPLAVLIREDKLYQLPNLMQRGRAFGMIRFDESLLEHVRAGRITDETALSVADSKKDLAAALSPASPAAHAPQKTGLLAKFGRKDGE